MPAFTGLEAQAPQFPIGSQNVHGSDGPSVADAASAANGAASGGPGHGDTADGSGQVTVPPVGEEPRLPIFDSLESDWFRRSGQPLSTTQRPQGAPTAPSPVPRARGSRPRTRAGVRLRRWRRPRREKLRKQGCRGAFRGLTSSQALSAAVTPVKEVQGALK